MFCGKTFLNGQYLLAHLERRHSEHRPFNLPTHALRRVVVGEGHGESREREREAKVGFCPPKRQTGFSALNLMAGGQPVGGRGASSRGVAAHKAITLTRHVIEFTESITPWSS